MQPAVPLTAAAERARVRVRGAVQGVGFRPFVYHLAQRYQLVASSPTMRTAC